VHTFVGERDHSTSSSGIDPKLMSLRPTQGERAYMSNRCSIDDSNRYHSSSGDRHHSASSADTTPPASVHAENATAAHNKSPHHAHCSPNVSPRLVGPSSATTTRLSAHETPWPCPVPTPASTPTPHPQYEYTPHLPRRCSPGPRARVAALHE
jgi:hypothetical protein